MWKWNKTGNIKKVESEKCKIKSGQTKQTSLSENVKKKIAKQGMSRKKKVESERGKVNKRENKTKHGTSRK